MSVQITGGHVPTKYLTATTSKNEFIAAQDQDTFVLSFIPVLTYLVVLVNGSAWQSIRYSNPVGNTILLDTKLNQNDYVIFKQ